MTATDGVRTLRVKPRDNVIASRSPHSGGRGFAGGANGSSHRQGLSSGKNVVGPGSPPALKLSVFIRGTDCAY